MRNATNHEHISPLDLPPQTTSSPSSLIHGRSEMAELCRSFDWSKTALGPLEGWSEALRAIVNVMLPSPIPTALYLGVERVLLYNDGFRPFAAARHPASFGAPAAGTWKEAWHVLGPQLDATFHRGNILHHQNFLLPLVIDGRLQDCYWDYSFSPIYDHGNIIGIFNVCQSTTARVIAERNLRDSESRAHRMEREQARIAAREHETAISQKLLLKLLQTQRNTTDPNAMMLAAAETAGHRLMADRTGFFDIVDPSTSRLTVCWTAGDLPLLQGDVPLIALGANHLAEAHAGVTRGVTDYASDPLTRDSRFADIGVRSGIGVPILRHGRWQSGFYVHCSKVREWTGEEVAFAREVANQTNESVQLALAQQALRRAEARSRKILESIGDAVIVTDAEARVTGMNPVAEELTGWSAVEAREVRLDKVLRLIDEATGEPIEAAAEPLNASPPGSLDACAALLVRRNGSELHMDHGSSPIREQDGSLSGFVITFRDTTVRCATEQRLRQAYKMEALGQLTGGIAHDFNNILAIIMGNLELVGETLGGDAVVRERIEQALASAEKAADLTRRLLAYARQQPLNPTIVDMELLVNAAGEFIRRSLGPAIVLRVIADEELWPVRIDRNQFENALLNLAVNARDAMPDGGQLTIHCQNFVSGKAARNSEIAPGEYLLISIADTGQGMDTTVRMRAAEPFFTTKPVGQGTGLGLSMVYGFLKQSGGHMDIESQPAVGTRIMLYLPRAVRAPEHPTAARRRPQLEQLPRGDEVVLVVEDEFAIRRTIGYLLNSLGYRVLEAEDGAGALLHLQATHEIDLMLTDVILPNGISGPALATRARPLRPTMKIIFSSGYTSNVLTRDYNLQEGVHLLNKPFHLADLAKMVRRVLDLETK